MVFDVTGPLIHISDLAIQFDVSVRAIYRRMKNDGFPKKIILRGRTYFSKKEIEEWVSRNAVRSKAEYVKISALEHDRVSVSDIARMCNVTSATVRAWSKLPGFPLPVLSGKRKQWRFSDIRAWVTERNRTGTRIPYLEARRVIASEIDGDDNKASFFVSTISSMILRCIRVHDLRNRQARDALSKEILATVLTEEMEDGNGQGGF